MNCSQLPGELRYRLKFSRREQIKPTKIEKSSLKQSFNKSNESSGQKNVLENRKTAKQRSQRKEVKEKQSNLQNKRYTRLKRLLQTSFEIN